MPLKKSSGNMYPWVTHTHNHLGGECPHRCSYCYVDNPRFGRPARYTGPVRLIDDELRVNYGEGRTIFVENMGDLFAAGVPDSAIAAVLAHCCAWPANTYVFQTKNPLRVLDWVSKLPLTSLLGTTIESDRHYPEVMVDAPPPLERVGAMVLLASKAPHVVRFVTVEPMLACCPLHLTRWIYAINPWFVNIGIDSKGHGLPEPTADQIRELIAALKALGIEIREKHNLARLTGATA